jgi:quinol-cytochrome oxidoreductase complex cytochrome b subunit
MFGFLSNNLLFKSFYNALIIYPCPKNMKYSWNFGILAFLFLMIQLISGFILSMHYQSNILDAFNSVEHIVRDINYGWLLRAIHSNGASFFFFFVYLHLIRGLYYQTYLASRGLIWSIGILIYFLLMASAFLGYVLPWGQMSYWAATVITNLVTVVPFFGTDLLYWIWGGYSINNATLTRFFILHYLLPFLIFFFVLFHIYVLHQTGSSSEVGISPELFSNINKITWFFPYYIVKDLFVCLGVVLVFSIFCFFYPEYFNHPDNYNYANPLVTPSHIVPEWYFLPYYGLLRSILSKTFGIIVAFISVLCICLQPLIKTYITTKYKNSSFLYFLYIAEFNFFFLGIIGSLPPLYPVIELGLFCTWVHLSIFFICYPILFYLMREFEFVELSNA